MSDIKDILTEFNYPYKDMGNYLNFPALWRGGNDQTSVAYYKDKQIAVDFVDGQKYGLKELVAVIIGDKTRTEEWFKGNKIPENIEYKEKLKVPEFFDQELLQDLIQDFGYITDKRGISLETAKTFSCGTCLDSQKLIQKLKNRQIFCIYNSQKKLVGFSGRALDDNNKIRHKHLGNKSLWVYPAHLNSKIIKETKEVFLVEGIFDLMRLWDLNIKNVLVLWGTEASFSIVNYLLKINPKTIYICTNNELDSENGGVGNEASKKIFGRLKKYFNLNQIKIYLPPAKDFCEIKDDKIIKDWYNNRYN